MNHHNNSFLLNRRLGREYLYSHGGHDNGLEIGG
jgi:hypothetical protein